jgi:hypothetical protein
LPVGLEPDQTPNHCPGQKVASKRRSTSFPGPMRIVKPGRGLVISDWDDKLWKCGVGRSYHHAATLQHRLADVWNPGLMLWEMCFMDAGFVEKRWLAFSINAQGSIADIIFPSHQKYASGAKSCYIT